MVDESPSVVNQPPKLKPDLVGVVGAAIPSVLLNKVPLTLEPPLLSKVAV